MDTLLIIGLIIGLTIIGYGIYRLRRWERYWMDRFTDNQKEY